MKWTGIVPQPWNKKIAIRLSSEKIAHARSMPDNRGALLAAGRAVRPAAIRPARRAGRRLAGRGRSSDAGGGFGGPGSSERSGSSGGELVTFTAHRLDQA